MALLLIIQCNYDINQVLLSIQRLLIVCNLYLASVGSQIQAIRARRKLESQNNDITLGRDTKYTYLAKKICPLSYQ